MRRTCSPCCARAASGRAAAPPSAAINCRRPMVTGIWTLPTRAALGSISQCQSLCRSNARFGDWICGDHPGANNDCGKFVNPRSGSSWQAAVTGRACPSARGSVPALFYDPRTLPQRNPCVWPSLARSPIGRPRDNEILHAGEVLKDVLAVISPDVDAVDKGSGSGLVVSYRNGSWLVCGCVDCARDNLELRVHRLGARKRHAKCQLNSLTGCPDANGEVLE